MKRLGIYTFLSLLNIGVVFAQEAVDTTLDFPLIEIKSSGIRNQPAGSTGQHWTTPEIGKLPVNNLAELLATQTGTFIKSYGQGSLATSSIRGASAGHTLVLWNGLPIQNPMLGQLDLALLPVSIAEAINFQKGGNTSLWGSGAIGGVLALENAANFDNRLRIQSNSQTGNFGLFQQQFRLGFGKQNWQSVTRFSYQEARNDFDYFLAPGLPERRQTNAQVFQHNFLQDFYLKLGLRQSLSVHFWRQRSDREIPPTNLQNRSEAHQDDQANRLIVHYRYAANRAVWQLKSGLFDEHLNYFDEQIGLESRSRFRTLLGDITGQWSWKSRHQLLIGSTFTYTEAWSAGYDEVPSEERAALFASWQYQGLKWRTQLSLRQTVVHDTWAPIVPSFGFNYKINPNLHLSGKVSKNFRLPTLNDRYWSPGGDPNLLPEAGWSQELALAQKGELKNLRFSLSVSAFNRNINNWILWSIPEGQSFWSANNIAKVWSRGLEPRFSLNYQWKTLQVKWSGGYDYIRSTNEVALVSPRIGMGEQLIYTPVHQAFSTIALNWKSWYLSYHHRYTGSARGINDPLDAYQVGNFRLQYTLKKAALQTVVYFNVHNVWDTHYLVVERRPMPGRNYQAGINIHFNSKQKK